MSGPSRPFAHPVRHTAAEVDRYIVLPGQATAYKVGQLTLLRLREQARDALGEAYDERSFHTVVLQHGQRPLPVVERAVDAWVAQATESG